MTITPTCSCIRDACRITERATAAAPNPEHGTRNADNLLGLSITPVKAGAEADVLC